MDVIDSRHGGQRAEMQIILLVATAATHLENSVLSKVKQFISTLVAWELLILRRVAIKLVGIMVVA
jgi:hypothetical protein